MSAFSAVQLPAAFTQYIEDNYYAQVTAQSRLEAVVRDPEFLNNPLKHVALFSDHGVLHGRDIAGKIVQVIRQIHGLLIPRICRTHQIYRRHWYAPYSVEDFTQLFAGGKTRPNLPTRRATSLEQDVQRLTRRGRAVPLAIHLMRLLPDGDSLRQFMSYLEEITLSEGASLFKAGDRPEALYFLEFGRIATVSSETLEPVEAFQPGDLIGGWAFFSGAAYSESAIAQRSSTVHRLSAQSLQQMQTAAPQVANQFANHLLTVFAEQIQQAQRAIASLHQERTETIGRLSTS
ncbi:Crp/Fnr family transcriptional regulator [Thermoleptolyngbya sp.]